MKQLGILKRLICRITRHDWQFAYNYGVPLGCKESFEDLKAKFLSGEVFPVNQCSRCGEYDHESDGLNSYTELGFPE